MNHDASNAVADAVSHQSATGTLSISAVREHLDRAVTALLSKQRPDGHWCAELEGDSILSSEYILLKWIIGQEDDPRLPAIAAYMRKLQQPDGGWCQYPGGQSDISAVVKAYFTLKLMGDDPQAPHMVKARERVLALGGAEKCNSFSKFYLAALGQISYNAVPSIPPEMVYLPRWFYFHLDKVSAWTRVMITPLSIVTTHRPVRHVPRDLGIDELYIDQKARHRLVPTNVAHRGWTTCFLYVDRLLKLWHKLGMTPWRKRALKRIEDWLLARTERSDGVGAIFPPMVYILIALKYRGYPDNHPKVLEAHKVLDELMIHDEAHNEIRIQPCFSPVWDTGIAAYALADAGYDHTHEAVARCRDWLVAKECREPGDWVNNVRQKVEPSGWFFEYENGFYPDVDDTVMVAMALKRIGGQEALAAGQRGIDWVLAMQNDDGGWAAFDRGTQGRPILEYVPFADHNAIQDPSCPDITGRTLESLSYHGFDTSHPAVQKAIAYVKSRQEPEGCWFGRWGVNYIYGTWQAVCGLERIGCDISEPWIQRAGQWLKQVQKEDGSFGETANSYEDRSLMGQGPSTASQTAWGVMALMSLYGPHDPAVQRGILWLCRTQLTKDHPESDDPAGSWTEPWFTGTGFPKVFYLRYHLYRLYFPVMAMGRWLTRMGGRG